METAQKEFGFPLSRTFSLVKCSTEIPPRPKSMVRKIVDFVWWFMKDQWWLLSLGILVAISSQAQVPASHQSTKAQAVNYGAVAAIFLIVGCTLNTKTVLENLSNWKIHLFVQILGYFMTSATAFGIVSICATNPGFMDPAILVGIIIMGCLPTTYIMTKKSKGNGALAITQSTIGNFIGPFLSTVLIKMYTSTGAWFTDILPKNSGGYGEIYKHVFKQLGLSMFLPIFVGQLIMKIFPNQTKKVFVTWKVAFLQSFALLIIIWSVFDAAFQSGAFDTLRFDNMIFLVFISVAFYILWFTISVFASHLWLPKQDTVAVAFCVPTKTPAMGLPLANVLFTGMSVVNMDKLGIPLVIFQGIQSLLGCLVTIGFRRWLARDEEKVDEEKIELVLGTDPNCSHTSIDV